MKFYSDVDRNTLLHSNAPVGRQSCLSDLTLSCATGQLPAADTFSPRARIEDEAARECCTRKAAMQLKRSRSDLRSEAVCQKILVPIPATEQRSRAQNRHRPPELPPRRLPRVPLPRPHYTGRSPRVIRRCMRRRPWPAKSSRRCMVQRLSQMIRSPTCHF